MSIKNKTTVDTLSDVEKITGCKLTLGKLIWAIRKCEEISQVNFAKKLGISKQHLCDIEHERKSISPKLAATYAKKLGYLPQQFVQLSLQEIVDRDGLKITVEIKPNVEKNDADSMLFRFKTAKLTKMRITNPLPNTIH